MWIQGKWRCERKMVLFISFKCVDHIRGVIGRWIFGIGIEFVKSWYMRAGNFLIFYISRQVLIFHIKHTECRKHRVVYHVVVHVVKYYVRKITIFQSMSIAKLVFAINVIFDVWKNEAFPTINFLLYVALLPQKLMVGNIGLFHFDTQILKSDTGIKLYYKILR